MFILIPSWFPIGSLGYAATSLQVHPRHHSALLSLTFPERSGMSITSIFFSVTYYNIRHCISNLLLSSVLPGPKEQTPDELQHYLCPVVNNLKQLWRDGIHVQTPSCLPGESKYLQHLCKIVYSGSPPAQLVQVILVAVICDKPAAHKMGGFSSRSHNSFCSCCKIKQSDLRNSSSYEPEGN